MKDLRNLPAPVLERLAANQVDTERSGIDVVQLGRRLEARGRQVEVRANEDGTVGLHGYATVYDYAYDVAGGPAAYGWSETIVGGACTKSVLERDDVRCLFDHEGIPIARTRSNTMTLTSDATGLLTDVPALDPASPYVQSLCSALARGDLDEMSFAFRTLRQEWNADYTERRILEVKLFDVSVVTYPANPATVVQLRDATPPAAAGAPISLAFAQAVADQHRYRA